MSTSRIPIQNIYYLLCYAWDKIEEREILDVDPQEGRHVVDLLGRVLANGMAHLLRRGLHRGYVPVSEDSRMVRGRVDFGQTTKRLLLQQARVHVNFDELSYDVPHNRILKSTLSRLLRNEDLDARVRESCYDVLRRMPEVSEVELTGLAFREVQLGRHTSVYDLLIRICQLVHENLLPTERHGRSRFRDFERDPRQMRLLFQHFVENFYRREQTQYRVPRGEQRVEWVAEPEDDEAEKVLPRMLVDVVLSSPERRILIDTKFTERSLAQHHRSEVQRLRSEHLYQMHAYLRNDANTDPDLEREGILLYPTVERELDVAYRLPEGTMRVATVNLAQPWSEIEERLLSLVRDEHNRFSDRMTQ